MSRFEFSALQGHGCSHCADKNAGHGVGAVAIAGLFVGLLCACSIEGFLCEQSDQCGDSGICQPAGRCSFPDGTCDSGQRYGDHSGLVSGECVVVETMTEAATATTSPPDPTTVPMTSDDGESTTTVGGGESTTEVDGTTDTEGSSTTGPPPPACSRTYVDSFDGNAVGEGWWITGDPASVAVEGGAVTMTISATPGVEYVQLILQIASGLDLRDGWVRVEISAVPVELRKQGTLTISTEDGSYLWLAESGIRPSAPEAMLPGLGEWDPVAHRWLQMRGSAGELIFEFSEDAITWNEASRIPASPGLVDAGLRLTAGHYEDSMTTADFVVETFEVCYD